MIKISDNIKRCALAWAYAGLMLVLAFGLTVMFASIGEPKSVWLMQLIGLM